MHYEFSKNRIGKESICITWIKNSDTQKDSINRESKNARREPKNARREPKNAYREPKNARGIF